MKKSIILIVLLMLILNVFGEDLSSLIKKGDLKEVKKIIKLNPYLIKKTDKSGNTPLHTAASNNQVEIVGFLLSKNADVNIKNKYDAMPLLYAADRKNFKIVSLLIKAGSKIDNLSSYGTPLFRAVRKGALDIAKLLVKHGADINKKTVRQNWNLLHLTFGKYPEMVQFLINKGVDKNAVGTRGRTPLHQALNSASDNADAAMVLIKNGSVLNILDNNGDSPLRIAVKKGFSRIVRKLLKKGADISILDKETKRTLLHLSAISGYSEICKILIENGLDKTKKDKFGITAFDYAREHRNYFSAELLNKKFLKKEKVYKIEDKEAQIWMLKNRGWVIKTKNNLFVFNNEELGKKPDRPNLYNGYISSEEIKEENIISLYTTFHVRPHQYLFIHGIENKLKNITYLQYKKDPWKGEHKNLLFLEGRSSNKINNAEVYSFETKITAGMGALGYVIKADGLVIYLAPYNPMNLDNYKKEIDIISKKYVKCDIAILHLNDIKKDKKYLVYPIEKLGPKEIFLSHVGRHKNYNRKSVFSELKEYKVKLNSNLDPGDTYIFK